MPESRGEKSLSNFAERWKKSFETGELKGHLPTAYLFSGPKGSGRREAADTLAKTLLGRLENHPDLIRIVPDRKSPKSEKVSIRIESVRQLISRLSLKPFEGSRIVVIVEDADLITDEAANSLLKTLEEPSPYVLFILITSAPDRLPATVRSRCQRVSFSLSHDEIRERAETLFLECQGEVIPLLKKPSFTAVSRFAESVARQPEKLPPVLETLKGLWHDLAVYRETGDEKYLLLPKAKEVIQALARERRSERIFEETDLIGETERALEGNVNKTLALERLFMKLTEP